MARTILDQGTQTATVGTEHTIKDDTTYSGSVLDAYVDLANMQAGDVVELRIYVKLRTISTLHAIYYATYADEQIDEGNYKLPVVYIPGITEPAEWKLTLKQTTGTGRAYDWIVYRT
jgi:hypothetical protein